MWHTRRDEAPSAGSGDDPGVCFRIKSRGALKCSILGAFKGWGWLEVVALAAGTGCCVPMWQEGCSG